MAGARAFKKIALVLGGGLARGISHIGILKVLRQEQIPVDLIVGTSIGSLIGAVYALDMSLDEAEERACAIALTDLSDITVPRFGFNRGKKLDAFIRSVLKGATFEDCRIPLAVVAVDIETGDDVICREGDLAAIVRASCSIPGMFVPVKIGNRLLVDGGIKETVPVTAARNLGADFIIACDVGFCVKTEKITNIIQIIVQAFQIKGRELNTYQSSLADFVIEPELGDIQQIDLHRASEALEAGYTAAHNAIPELKQKLRI